QHNLLTTSGLFRDRCVVGREECGEKKPHQVGGIVMVQHIGQCDRCPTLYDVGPHGFKRIGDLCADLSMKPVSGWPDNGCLGRVVLCDSGTVDA
ncbi:MAG: hypothetical protein ABIU05_17300, partial [Nitrospirales bacterium]